MAACSTYFKALFTNQLSPYFNSSAQIEYHIIEGIEPDIMEIIINYAYTEEAEITPENIELLLPVADQFHVFGLLRLCVNFLRQNLSIENCIGIWMLAKHHFCTSLERAACRFLLKHFTEVATYSQEFVQLSVEEVLSVLCSEHLNATNEETTFEAAIRWISHNPESRKRHILDLLRCVRLGWLNFEYFDTQIKENEFVKAEPKCAPLLAEAQKLLETLDIGMYSNADFTHPLTRPRIPVDVLFVIGGWTEGNASRFIETYDAKADRWIPLSTTYEDKVATAYHGCVSLRGQIYVIGGFDGVEHYNQVRSFDPARKKWSVIAPMHHKRCYVNVTVHNDKIYAMGGYNGHARLPSAERYNPDTNQWSQIAAMHNARSDAAACALRDFVYCIGGFNGYDCLDTGEYYNPQTDQWTYIAPLSSPRSGVGVVMYHGYIYAVGGYNGSQRLNTVEKFDQVRNIWKPVPELHSQRSNFAIEVTDDKIFVIGGFNGVTTIKDVECFDGKREEWYDVCDMNLNRSALGAAVVKDLPNVKDYIIKRTK
ncbi:kelch-like protein 10 [Lingula anatina]|uniref:Kelch-like protein 10 n=1 Tax=Lingula anatina TaxID=7574 RepID=A0A1S3HPH4_LINAN|nr:kelch-like protein 10 [Lingula anatina]|eukprot:XP_013387935.1 kelch-like protein 10 [Lingula anatina]